MVKTKQHQQQRERTCEKYGVLGLFILLELYQDMFFVKKSMVQNSKNSGGLFQDSLSMAARVPLGNGQAYCGR